MLELYLISPPSEKVYRFHMSLLMFISCITINARTNIDIDMHIYREISNLSRTKSQSLNVSRRVLQLALRNLLKPGVRWSMKM